ncbi:MAG: DsbC family protein [Betaproteobacteria bacterium]|nr:DsbC family protein [Betaproteobacteria bacterium]
MRRFLLIALLLGSVASSFARADESQIRRDIESRFPGVKVDSITKTPYFGLYEVLIGSELLYTDEKVTYFFNGSVIDAKTRRNLTEERQQKLSAIKFEDLPLDLAVKQVKGNGKRIVAVFSDPNCPYCKSFDRQLTQMQDLTIYTFLYPILRPDSVDKSKAIWCAKDRAKAYYDWMLSGKAPFGPANCSAPVDKVLALGERLGIRATPTSFVASGERVMGARIEDLKKLLDEQPTK